MQGLGALIRRGQQAVHAGRPQEARAIADQIARGWPHSDEARSIVGMLQFQVEDYRAAIATFSRILRKEPNTWLVMGAAYMRLGDMARAAQCIRNEKLPPAPTVDYDLIRRLRAGDEFERGAAEMIAGSAVLDQFFQPPTIPKWDGGKVGRLAVLFRGGYGDSFLCARYLRGLRARASHVTAVVRDAEIALLSRSIPNIEFVKERDSEPALAAAQAYTTENLLSYESGERFGAAVWAKPGPRLKPAGAGLHVGLCWNGSLVNPEDRLRSVPVEDLAPLFEVPGVTWHSLQVGIRAGQCPAPLINHADELRTFDDTAALIAGLSVVISADCSVANLAGAMGARLWTLISRPCDFRWGAEGTRTPWFPSARVYRQTVPGQWGDAVEGVRADLVAQ